MLSARIECRKRQQRLPPRKTIRVETVVGKALLAVVIDLAVVLRVGGGHGLVARHERRVCRLQLGKDGELLEFSVRLAGDVDSSERLVQLAQRPPHKRPRAHPGRVADGFHRRKAHAAVLDREARLPGRSRALRRGACRGSHNLVKGLLDEIVVQPGCVNGDGGRHGT